MAVMASVLLLLATAALERDVLSALPPWSAGRGFYCWLTINCSFAFATNLSNFIVIKHTSPLTMQVRRATYRVWIGLHPRYMAVQHKVRIQYVLTLMEGSPAVWHAVNLNADSSQRCRCSAT